MRWSIMECIECYSEDNTKRPRLGDLDCLENHEQYICGTCGRCICRWTPIKTFAKMELSF